MTPADEAALREIAAKIRTCPTDTEVMDAVVKAFALGRASGCIHQFGVSCFCGDHYVPDGCLSVTSANGWQHSMERCEAPLVTDDQRASALTVQPSPASHGKDAASSADARRKEDATPAPSRSERASVADVEQRESFAKGNLAIDREPGARKTIASVSGGRCAFMYGTAGQCLRTRDAHETPQWQSHAFVEPTDRNAGREAAMTVEQFAEALGAEFMALAFQVPSGSDARNTFECCAVAVRRAVEVALKGGAGEACDKAAEVHDAKKHRGPFGECDREPCNAAHMLALRESLKGGGE